MKQLYLLLLMMLMKLSWSLNWRLQYDRILNIKLKGVTQACLMYCTHHVHIQKEAQHKTGAELSEGIHLYLLNQKKTSCVHVFV